jgi:hypothetical protein
MNQVECYVKLYGEQYRDLIEDALSWIKSRAPEWGVTFDRVDEDAYIEDLLSRVRPKEKDALS